MDLSILIPIYNSKEKILRCLRSITRQNTNYIYEIICVDDGSDTLTLKLLKQAEKEIPNFQLFCIEHSGVATARNICLAHATGTYIMFIDSDDELLDNSINILMEKAISYNADLVQGAYILNGKKYGLSEHEVTIYRDEDKLYFSGYLWGKVMRRSCWKHLHFYDEHYYEDLIMHIIVYPLTKLCVYVPNSCYDYHRNADGLSERLKYSEKINDSYKTIDYYLNSAKEMGMSIGRYHKAFFDYYVFVICKTRFQTSPVSVQKNALRRFSEIEKKYWRDKAIIFLDIWDNINMLNVRPKFIEPVTVKRLPSCDETIILAVDYSFLPMVSVVIQSILECNTSLLKYDVIILHDDLSYSDYHPILEGFSTDEIIIRFVNVHQWVSSVSFGIQQHQCLNITTYFRLFIPYILECAYEKVLYLDCDIVVNADLSELFSIPMEDMYLVSTVDITGLAEYYTPGNRKKVYRDAMFPNMRPEEYFIAGMMLLNLNQFRTHISFSEMKSLMEKTTWKQYDQDILNHVCQGKVKLISPVWDVVADFGNNKFLPSDIRKIAYYSEQEPKIIHYGGGSRKPWKKYNIPYFERFWAVAKHTNMYEKLILILKNNQEGSNEQS